jgi:iron complex transport system permease protein
VSADSAAGPALAARAALLVAAVGVVVVGALLVGGASSVSPLDAARVLAGVAPDDGSTALARALVFEVRLPRVILLLLAGAALAASGAALQAALENPLAAPGLLGLTGGASAGAVAAITSGLSLVWAPAVPLAAFAGGLGALALVYGISFATGRPTTGTLLLTGVAVASLTSSAVSVMLLAAGSHRVHEIVAWLLGSAETASWREVQLAVVPVTVGIGALVLSARVIDALALGEEHALGSGVDVLRARAGLFALVALASGGAVSVVGPIGFVGLIVPHAMRAVVGPAARRLMPTAALAGGSFLVLCDALSRTISRGVDVPVGVVTAAAGVPFFLVLLHRRRR